MIRCDGKVGRYEPKHLGGIKARPNYHKGIPGTVVGSLGPPMRHLICAATSSSMPPRCYRYLRMQPCLSYVPQFLRLHEQQQRPISTRHPLVQNICPSHDFKLPSSTLRPTVMRSLSLPPKQPSCLPVVITPLLVLFRSSFIPRVSLLTSLFAAHQNLLIAHNLP